MNKTQSWADWESSATNDDAVAFTVSKLGNRAVASYDD
jgi:hypothetical protein